MDVEKAKQTLLDAGVEPDEADKVVSQWLQLEETNHLRMYVDFCIEENLQAWEKKRNE